MIPPELPVPRLRPKRWLALLLASALLHGIVLDLAGGQIGMPMPAPQSLPPDVVSVHLQAALSPPVPVTVARPPRPKPKRLPKLHPAPTPVRHAPDAPAVPDEAVAVTDVVINTMTDTTTDQDTAMVVPDSNMTPVIAQAPDVAAAPVDATATAPSPLSIDPPPSVLLKYQVESSKDGRPIYGSGKIAWNARGGAYAINGEASVLFFTVLEFHSEGEFDSFGVAPLLYTEKRMRKPVTNTHFQSDPKVVSFSASTATYPRQGGEQDRATIVWQLAALGRGSGRLFAPGAQLDVVVAGVRDAETWDIRVIGLETIKIPAGEMQAWHLARQPRAASFDQKIDIWLAPQQQWYPVRIRYTDKNGDYLDMAASAIEPVAVIEY